MKIKFENIYVCIVFFIIGVCSQAQQSNLKFGHVSLPDNVNTNEVNCFLETKERFLWIGTKKGLIRYDGYNTLRIDSRTKEGIVNEFGNVNTLLNGEKGNIWVGTGIGVFIYNSITGITKRFSKLNFKGTDCRILYKTKSNEIVIGTTEGLYIYDKNKNEVYSYRYRNGFTQSLSNDIVRCIYEDNAGVLWIGTYDQLNKLDRKNNTIDHYKLQDNINSNVIQNNLILSIAEVNDENKNYLLVGTETGLVVFNKETTDFVVYTKGIGEKKLSNSVIKSIVVISPQQIWLGTDMGLNIFNLKTCVFEKYYANYNNTYTITDNVVNTIYVDSKKNIWLGTKNGVDNAIINKSNFLHNQIHKKSSFFDESYSVLGIDEDLNGDIWFSTNKGFCKYSQTSNSYSFFYVSDDLTTKVIDLLVAKDGNIWLATSQGLHVYNPKKNKFNSFYSNKNNEYALQTNYIRCLYEDSLGNIWIGTYKGGLYRTDISENNKKRFIQIKPITIENEDISSLSVLKIIGDSKENIWIATDKGVKQINLVTGNIQQLKTNGKYVSDIYLEDNTNLWLSSQNSILKLNLKTSELTSIEDIPEGIMSIVGHKENLWFSTFRNLYRMNKNGLKLEQMSTKETGIENYTTACFVNKNEEYFFGGTNGFVMFNPKEIEIDSTFLEVQFTNLKVLNKIVAPFQSVDEPSILSKNINNIDVLDIDYSENTFALEFSTLNYSTKEKGKYKYILDGYESDWQVVSGKNHIAYYTRVKPGNYTFKVKSANSYGVFPEDYRSLKIVVRPPLWASSLAIFIYVLVLFTLFYLSRKLLISRIHDKNDLRLEKMQRSKSEELIEVKTRFFTNISHELKTPLTLILSPTERLIKNEKDEKKRKTLHIIQRNTERLIRLVNQVLDVRKIETQKVHLRKERYDLVRFSKKIVGLFEEEAMHRKINLNFSSEVEKSVMWFDMEKVEKIIFNLISNAFKFTPDGGHIQIEVCTKNREGIPYTCIKVSDTGIGISKDNLKLVFDRFTNINSRNFTSQEGTGIGLSLVQDYVKLHGGFVELKSKENRGSVFSVYIPVVKSIPEKEVKKEEDQTDKLVLTSQENYMISEEDYEAEEKLEISGKLRLLIVEDDRDMRSFISSVFEDDFELFLASDGKEGCDLAFKNFPDLIISDVMMPIMDGISLCKKLKSDVRTSHIPIILLTAKGGVENKMEGIGVGADDYIQKPFHLDFLLLRTKMLITQREKLRKSYSKEDVFSPSEVTYNPVDEKFLQELLAIIDSQMDNSELTVQLLAELMQLERTNLYRKVKAITGETATAFIRNIRLKKAGQLLKEEQFNVSDVMYMVGFSHRSYFARSFKEYFGMVPTDYKAKYK